MLRMRIEKEETYRKIIVWLKLRLFARKVKRFQYGNEINAA